MVDVVTRYYLGYDTAGATIPPDTTFWPYQTAQVNVMNRILPTAVPISSAFSSSAPVAPPLPTTNVNCLNFTGSTAAPVGVVAGATFRAAIVCSSQSAAADFYLQLRIVLRKADYSVRTVLFSGIAGPVSADPADPAYEITTGGSGNPCIRTVAGSLADTTVMAGDLLCIETGGHITAVGSTAARIIWTRIGHAATLTDAPFTQTGSGGGATYASWVETTIPVPTPPKPIFHGANAISDLYVGNNGATAAYLGSTQLY